MHLLQRGLEADVLTHKCRYFFRIFFQRLPSSAVRGFMRKVLWNDGLAAIWFLKVNDICQAVAQEYSLTKAS